MRAYWLGFAVGFLITCGVIAVWVGYPFIAAPAVAFLLVALLGFDVVFMVVGGRRKWHATIEASGISPWLTFMIGASVFVLPGLVARSLFANQEQAIAIIGTWAVLAVGSCVWSWLTVYILYRQCAKLLPDDG